MADAALRGLVNLGTGQIDIYGFIVDSDLPSLPKGTRVGVSGSFTGELETVTGSLRVANPRM